MDVQLPDGRILRGVPDGTTKAQIAAKMGLSMPEPPPPQALSPAQTMQTENPLGRTMGRVGRNIASGVAAAADTALLIPKTAMLGGSFAYDALGAPKTAEALRKYGMMPSLHDSTQGLVDQATGDTLKPTGTMDKAFDFGSEMVAGAAPVMAQKTVGQTPKALDAVRTVFNPSEPIAAATNKVPSNVMATQRSKVLPSSQKSFKNAGQAYEALDSSGTTLTPEGVQKFVAAAEKAANLDSQVLTVFPNSQTAQTLRGLRSLAETGEPVKIQTLHKLVKNLNQAINKHFKDGLDEDGLELLNMKDAILEAAQANPEDLTGGMAGFDAWQQANKFYTQGSRLEDVEKVIQRAKLTKNPHTSLQTGARNLLLNAKKTRGYSDEQLAALEKMAETGIVGDVLHVFGNRLIPAMASTAGAAVGSWPGAIIAGGAAHIGSTAARAGATGLQMNKAKALMQALGGEVPAGVSAPISAQKKAMAAALANMTARGQ